MSDIVDGELCFRGKYVATVLVYSDTTQALRVNVECDYEDKLEELRAVSHTPVTFNERTAVYRISQVSIDSDCLVR